MRESGLFALVLYHRYRVMVQKAANNYSHRTKLWFILVDIFVNSKAFCHGYCVEIHNQKYTIPLHFPFNSLKIKMFSVIIKMCH